ncbi:ATP-binding protein [Algicella marina]|uniref:histidine kinase n=1 Tax=Algicella marina TaxID=2683284 RepID=A0A6P1SZR8_9RHOB|nr:ATP-binding protein [Algicella marina]QHQ33732.1 response regulator [Algicella marina]
MQTALWDILSAIGFLPYGQMLLERSDLFWVAVVAQGVTFLSCSTCAIILLHVAAQHKGAGYVVPVAVFAIFLVMLGFAEALLIAVLWAPVQTLSFIVQLVVAVLALTATIVLYRQAPRLLKLPTQADMDAKDRALAHEVEERAEAERKLRDSRSAADARLMDRVRDLEERNDALMKAQAETERSNIARSDLLATVSHEVRTPMNGVKGMLELLNADGMELASAEIVDRASEATDNLLTVINDILDHAKLESGRMTLLNQRFSPRAIMDGAVSLMEAKALQKGLTLSATVSPDVPEMLIGDGARLRQVLLNLIGNAVKFTEAGRVDVRMAHDEVARDECRIDISVRDTGIGIERELQKQLFKQFFKGDASVTRRYGGAGLGLAISNQLVRLMGGRIDVTSEPGQGSAFRFSVRCRIDSAPQRASVNDSVLPSAVVQPLRVLVAEDNETNRFHLQHLLRRAGHEVDVVENGVMAIAAAEEKKYDLILMDIFMPEMDGTMAAQAIRSMEGLSAETPIVAITANAMVGDREHYMSKGMDEYIAKPIDANTLFSAIWRALGGRDSQAPA